MKKAVILLLVLVAAICFNTEAQTKPAAKETRTKVQIHTDLGDIVIALYNETPKHRDNFVKLVKEGWYNDSYWHRVIKGFMIQGGRSGGKEDPGYTVPAEIVSKFYHKRGALAAARTSDEVNPTRASSGSQFYIVQGNKFDDATLDAIEKRSNRTLTPEMRKAYKEQGGAPHLDGTYTIFGEVVSGMEVVDKIAAAQVDAAAKPVKDIKITAKIVK